MAPPRSWSDLNVLGAHTPGSGTDNPLHLPGSPELHGLPENHVICPPHPGHSTALPPTRSPSRSRKLTHCRQFREESLCSLPQASFCLLGSVEVGRAPLPGGGGPHPGALIFLSVKGHADRAAGTAAEVRRGGGVQVSGHLDEGCLLPLSLPDVAPLSDSPPSDPAGGTRFTPVFHTRTGPQLFTSHSWGRPRTTDSNGRCGLPA